MSIVAWLETHMTDWLDTDYYGMSAFTPQSMTNNMYGTLMALVDFSKWLLHFNHMFCFSK